MYYQNWSELKKFNPVKDGKWDQELLYEYLVSSCYKNFRQPLNDFFSSYQNDEALAELLFDFLLNEEYDGSESQIGAAFYLSKFDKTILKRKKICYCRPSRIPLIGNAHLKITVIWNGFKFYALSFTLYASPIFQSSPQKTIKKSNHKEKTICRLSS